MAKLRFATTMRFAAAKGYACLGEVVRRYEGKASLKQEQDETLVFGAAKLPFTAVKRFATAKLSFVAAKLSFVAAKDDKLDQQTMIF